MLPLRVLWMKGLTYRLLSASGLAAISFLVTGSFGTSGWITLGHLSFATIAYVAHETLWERRLRRVEVRDGRSEPPNVVPVPAQL